VRAKSLIVRDLSYEGMLQPIEDAGLANVIGGHVDVFFGNVAAARSLYRDGRVRIVALCDTVRSPALPEVPTTAEAGLPGLVSTGWFALVGPPKTSPTLQAAIAGAAIAAIHLPDVQEKFRSASVEPIGNTPAATAAFINEEAQRWGTVIKQNNISMD